MPIPIKITAGEVELDGELFDTDCARAIVAALPVSSPFSTWGDEFYFKVGVVRNRDEGATTDVEVGTIAYWPAGRAVALFFGPTPMSSGRKPVAADRVNIIGRITGDPLMLRRAKGAAQISICRADAED